MREVRGAQPLDRSTESRLSALEATVRELVDASRVGTVQQIAQSFRGQGTEDVRTINPATATLGDVAKTLDTLIRDMRAGGAKRT